MKGDSQKGMKKCLIALVFAVVLMAVVTIAALALAVINYSHLSGELTNKVNFLSGQFHQFNESKEADRELTNEFNLLSIQRQQSLSSTRDNNIYPRLSSILTQSKMIYLYYKCNFTVELVCGIVLPSSTRVTLRSSVHLLGDW